MFKPHTVLGFGLWFIAVSFLGIPAAWKIKLYLATGIVFVCIYLFHLGKETLLKLAKEKVSGADTYTENRETYFEEKDKQELP